MSLNEIRMGLKRHKPMGDSGPAERRKQQNRIAQRRYREFALSRQQIAAQDDLLVLLGDKITDQSKRLENFAQQARRLLTEAVELVISEPRCPECSHCRGLQIDDEAAGGQASSLIPGRGHQENKTTSSANFAIDASQEPTTHADFSGAGSRNFSHDESRKLSSSSFSPVQNGTSTVNEVNMAFTLSNTTVPLKISEGPAGFAGLPTPLSDQNFIDYLDLTGTDFISHDISAVTPSATGRPAPPMSPCQHTAAMQLAAKEGQTGILSIILRNGLYVDSRDEKGRTPLFQCAIHGQIEAGKVLLAAGADAKAVDAEGTSVMLAAVQARCEEMVELLLNHRR
jgi:hypothetical protein